MTSAHKYENEETEMMTQAAHRKERLDAIEFDRAIAALMSAAREMRLTEHEREKIIAIRRLWYNGGKQTLRTETYVAPRNQIRDEDT